jgi:hypothetical protein
MDDRTKNNSRQQDAHVLRLMAGGAGVGGGGDRGRQAQAGRPGRPWSLTPVFNAAAKKPPSAPTTDRQKQLVQELKETIESITKKAADRGAGGEAGKTASKHQLEMLKKQLSQPRHTHEMKPRGGLTSARDPDRDRRISQEILRMQHALKQNKGKAKAAFDRCNGRGL